jgi:hypothetical protein
MRRLDAGDCFASKLPATLLGGGVALKFVPHPTYTHNPVKVCERIHYTLQSAHASCSGLADQGDDIGETMWLMFPLPSYAATLKSDQVPPALLALVACSQRASAVTSTVPYDMYPEVSERYKTLICLANRTAFWDHERQRCSADSMWTRVMLATFEVFRSQLVAQEAYATWLSIFCACLRKVSTICKQDSVQTCLYQQRDRFLLGERRC